MQYYDNINYSELQKKLEIDRNIVEKGLQEKLQKEEEMRRQKEFQLESVNRRFQ